jgi:hypothetical protein
VTSRFAILVAPSDPKVSSAPARLEALGWLRNQVAPRGFQVAIVGSGADPLADLDPVAARIAPGDVVFVHVSGRLVTNDFIAVSGTAVLSLSAVTEHLAARSPGYMSLVLDLVRGEGTSSQPDPGELLSLTVQSLGAAERGYSVLAAVRPVSAVADRIAFTRLAMPPIDDGGPPSTEALLVAMDDRAAAANQHGGNGQSSVLVRGAPDPTIDGLVAQATQASDWRRVAELRLDRVDTLPSPAQRAQELVGVARVLLGELRDADGAIEVLEHARSVDPKRPAVLEALRYAYEASGRAPPIDPDDYATAFVAHRRAGQNDAALLDAMLLEELGVAKPEHRTVVEGARSAGPVQVLRALDGPAWASIRAPGFDDVLAARFAVNLEDAIAARVRQMKSSRRLPSVGSAARLDPESTVSAVRTLHWAARVLGVECPDLYPGADDDGEAVAHVAGERPAIRLAPRVLSGTSTKQLAFLAGRALAWYRPEYHAMLYYPTAPDLLEIAGAGIDATTLEHWVRSADLTAARAGLFLCGELKTAVAGVRGQPSADGRPTAERVANDLVAFCASRAHAALRAQFLKLTS